MSHQTNNTTVSHLTSSLSLQLGVMLVMGVAVVGCSKPKPTESSHPSYDIVKVDDANTNVGSYQVPQNTAMQNEPNYQQILYGQRLLDDTKRLLPNNVGADMNCNSCHIAHGKVPLGDPYINSFNAYPSYNPRAAKEVTLTERINGCFRRSMNGKPLPPQSAEMKAMLAYMQWLSKTVPKTIFAQKCASCHGEQGITQMVLILSRQLLVKIHLTMVLVWHVPIPRQPLLKAICHLANQIACPTKKRLMSLIMLPLWIVQSKPIKITTILKAAHQKMYVNNSIV